ncbi:MAG: hypothetical protein Q8M56_08055 [Desulfobacterales bacterium]|jgi:predicted DsbA family dithiol-disulfide isomerase|nr:hypothetical protein [Desulfobacterales bacterium]
MSDAGGKLRTGLPREKAITAVPAFVMKQDKLVGAQPYDVLERLMAANGIKKRS